MSIHSNQNSIDEQSRSDYVTESGIPIKPYYTPSDIAQEDSTLLGQPGEYPYTRGIHPNMYRSRTWTIRQLAGFATPEDTNQRFRLLLEQGATGINCVFDFPTNRGYDSNHPFAEGDVGQGGVAIDTLDDMLALFEGIPLNQTSVSLVLSHPVAAGVIFAMFLAAAQRRGYSLNDLQGTLQNDFMMETVILTAPNTLQPSFSFKLSMDVVEFCTRHVPKWNPISFTGYNYREAGANAVQEAALVIANALETSNDMICRGCEIDQFAPRLSSFFSSDNDFFEEIAKFRAARRIYSRLFQERFQPNNPRSSMLRFHVQTSGSALTAQQPLNNVIRSSFHSLAAVLGGAQSLHVSAYDEAICIPTEASAITALRTQQILLLETGVTKTVDPLGGSYYVESLTKAMEEKIEEYLLQIEKLGGLVKAVEQGWVHNELIQTSYERERAISQGKRKVVGVNCFTESAPIEVGTFKVPETLSKQTAKIEKNAHSRNQTQVTHAIAQLRAAVQHNENTIPFLIEAVKAGATVGECSNVFRELHGGWHQPLF
ncbi:acyl-CoA mutase large subunit family protein [Brevibacillus ginsengisoli]|uniref:acyl-CoA mutase large subunit family protein n=1 Tax=Brevibacillus ginsengisoli TaxID=363854 RepID=UPI003CF94EC7